MWVTLKGVFTADADKWSEESGGEISGKEMWEEVTDSFIEEFTGAQILKERPAHHPEVDLRVDLVNRTATVHSRVKVNVKASRWAQGWDTDGMTASEVRDQIAQVAEEIVIEKMGHRGLFLATVEKAF